MRTKFGMVFSRQMVAIAALALLAAACARNPDASLGAGGVPGAGLNGVGAGVNAGTAVPGSAQDFTVNVGDRIWFDTDSSSVNAAGQQTLDRQAQWLALYPAYTITIEGHADERGTREYNLALGARRAASVRDYLVARGIAPTRIRTISYGKERPVAVCDDITCWAQNRRAVTVLNGVTN